MFLCYRNVFFVLRFLYKIQDKIINNCYGFLIFLLRALVTHFVEMFLIFSDIFSSPDLFKKHIIFNSKWAKKKSTTTNIIFYFLFFKKINVFDLKTYDITYWNTSFPNFFNRIKLPLFLDEVGGMEDSWSPGLHLV